MSKYRSTNPMTGEVVAEYPVLDDTQVQTVLDQAQQAYLSWRRVEPAERTKVLSRVADLHRQHATELAELSTLEMGKPISQARGEVELAAAIFEYYAEEGPNLIADEELTIAGTGRAIVRTAAIGPLLGVMPWNFPYYQVARFVAPNLLLGNTILLKHAANCPQQALRIHDILAEAGAPAGVYTNIFATNDQVATMIANPILQGVSLTGSERAGTAVGELAGRHMKKSVLELGGSDALIVLADADLPAAITAAAAGRFHNAGQTCTSSKRIIVEDSVWDEFLTGFLDAADAWQIGDPTDPDTKVGPMASFAARDDLAAQVNDALVKGATLHLGGAVPESSASYYPATVISDLTPDMRAHREELFGPVALLHRVHSVDEAIEVANDSPFGLGSAIFTADEATALDVAERLDVGMVGINATVKSAPDLPFGGVKRSGIGRELGKFGLDEFANKKLIRIP
ncbi:succinate-semialdehyde dehydrogenase/glutarate-semialdehyde dehydrogenase [Branchiibius hedensis]|uniref:Succinate-semialdehyde dehydrogenase / glutarate-semialdehyde dehydrogenase n=1 Tax=Branchiibius hedensis TaxID=672460 RepID=A0A2Y8ZMZ4_9MICO|nr:NAD-dependent succinate-semialdehyde dehydrogenase [Branchiibius hedensis]PWJ24864.1 succinate-semialdehyde dehydrogenase/glutarate-semialdehyde dehydrogenase [Branchiibius hedensis]SSA33680.1 succinate-semialdehyde dehydrogenase / glutarate-semialdehyde dehydrogenase [Branchiibius hedensis]